MEQVVARDNTRQALKRVKANRGSPGVDGMTVEALSGYLVEHWVGIREQLLSGTYRPQPVRRCEIPKAGGGVRQLGIPTVLDRLIQQAVLQVLQPRFDASFSDSSFGFRPGRRAHDAVRRARAYIQAGRSYVVDVDLEKFFDRVNHDVLMGKLEQRIEDRRLLRLIRRCLSAGILADGVVIERHEGTPQGGPLSPLRISSLAQTPGVFRGLDEWLRHRLRMLHLKQWRRGRCGCVTSTCRTAGCGPACPVVWEGNAEAILSVPYPDQGYWIRSASIGTVSAIRCRPSGFGCKPSPESYSGAMIDGAPSRRRAASKSAS